MTVDRRHSRPFIGVGEICHIKAASPKGPRFDPEQTLQERHGYDNLILLCPVHHKIIDDDPEAYTVERLLKLKATHAARFTAPSDEVSEREAQILIDHSVVVSHQSGGITAHTVNQIYHSHTADPADLQRRQDGARKFLAPELQRTIEHILYIHGRAVVNFLCHSAGGDPKPNDIEQDFIPHWPNLYPHAPQMRDLDEADAAALIGFYDSLYTLRDDVNDWWEREGQLPVNIFNNFTHDASRSLKLALICINRFGLEALFPPRYASWGALSERIKQSLAYEAGVMEHHLARAEAKAAQQKAGRPLPGVRRR